MAKFCGNCGAASDDNANVCGNCGAPFAATKSGAGNILSKIPGVNDINIKPEQKALIMKIAKIAVPAVAALAVILIVIFAIIVPNTGAQGAVRDYVKALEKGDAAAIAEMLPAAYKSEDLFEESYDPEERMNDKYFEDEENSNSVEAIEKKYGEGYKFKIKDMDVKKFDKDDIEDYEEMYDNLIDAHKDSDFEAPEISAGCKIKFELVLKGDKKDKDAKCTVIMLKEDGKWVVWSVDTSVPGADPMGVLRTPRGLHGESE